MRRKTTAWAAISGILVVAGFAWAAPPAEKLRQKGFEKVTEKRGVTVFRKCDADAIRLFAEGRIPLPPERVREALLDYDRHEGVVGCVTESRILKRSAETLLVYQRLDVPIVSDRDMVLRVTSGEDRRGTWIRYKAIEGRGPKPISGVVRLRHYKGAWRLRPTADGAATIARLTVTMELGGSLPPSIARIGAGKDLPDLFEAIATLATRE